MLLSSLYVYFRDAAPIWDVLSQMLFYCSPVIVPLTSVQDKLSPTLVKIYMLNPLADDLPAVPPRDDQPRRRPGPARSSGPGWRRWCVVAIVVRGVRAGLRRVQPDRAVRSREPLTRWLADTLPWPVAAGACRRADGRSGCGQVACTPSRRWSSARSSWSARRCAAVLAAHHVVRARRARLHAPRDRHRPLRSRRSRSATGELSGSTSCTRY